MGEGLAVEELPVCGGVTPTVLAAVVGLLPPFVCSRQVSPRGLTSVEG